MRRYRASAVVRGVAQKDTMQSGFASPNSGVVGTGRGGQSGGGGERSGAEGTGGEVCKLGVEETLAYSISFNFSQTARWYIT